MVFSLIPRYQAFGIKKEKKWVTEEDNDNSIIQEGSLEEKLQEKNKRVPCIVSETVFEGNKVLEVSYPIFSNKEEVD